MKKGKLWLGAILAIHFGLTAWRCFRQAIWAYPGDLAIMLGLWVAAPLVLTYLVLRGLGWARWCLAALFGLRSAVEAYMGTKYFIKLLPLSPGGEVLFELVITPLVYAAVYLGLALALVRSPAIRHQCARPTGPKEVGAEAGEKNDRA
jgi:hypothetical protein